MAAKSSFLDKVLGRIGRLDTEGLQTVVQRLARERRFLETLFNTIEDGVLVVDDAGHIIYFNQAVTRLLGLGGSAENQPIARYLPELDWAELVAASKAPGQRVLRREFSVAFPRPRFLRLYAAPLGGESNAGAGVALILHDATEARQETFNTIESERVQALTLLAASVAHEIGNPINALHIHLQLVERELKKLRAAARPPAAPARLSGRRLPPVEPGHDVERIGAKMEGYLAVAKGEIARLDYIVTEFLQAIRPSLPQRKLGALNDVIRETLALLQPELTNRGLSVKDKLARGLPEALFDPGQVKQVLVNLIKNAMQAMSKGGTLTLESGAGAVGVWFSVSDTVAGVPQEQLNRIFEPFYTTKEKGTGLGLMIVQRIVRDHGGRIELESRAGQGATFRVWLPLPNQPPLLLEARSHE